jgi:hypothetical protein
MCSLLRLPETGTLERSLMQQRATAVRMWQEGIYRCDLRTFGGPHLRVSAGAQIIVEEEVTTWLQACDRAITLQEVAKRSLARLAS